MIRIRHILFSTTILFLVAGCSKMNPVDCFKNTGDITVEKRNVSSFRYLEMNDNVDVILSYGNQYSLEVRAGKNIIPGIKTEVDNEKLVIENENSCNWVRNYESPIEVHVTAPQLDSIIYQASGNLVSANKFISDSLKIDVLEGGGSIQLWVELEKGFFNLHYGTVDMNIRGYSHISYLSSASYGYADLSKLDTEFTFMSSNSLNDCRVRSHNTLHVKILNVGDVYYSGSPFEIKKEIYGEGHLYKE